MRYRNPFNQSSFCYCQHLVPITQNEDKVWLQFFESISETIYCLCHRLESGYRIILSFFNNVPPCATNWT